MNILTKVFLSISDEAMIRLTNAAIQNHYGSQFSILTDDIINLKDTPNAVVPRYKCC